MEKVLLAGEAGTILRCGAQNVKKLVESGKLKVAFKTPTGVRIFLERDVLDLAARRNEKNRNRK